MKNAAWLWVVLIVVVTCIAFAIAWTSHTREEGFICEFNNMGNMKVVMDGGYLGTTRNYSFAQGGNTPEKCIQKCDELSRCNGVVINRNGCTLLSSYANVSKRCDNASVPCGIGYVKNKSKLRYVR
ncbi:hypothetical protein EBT25_14995 [bacterium]|nr:hypothetical protein [bacterium]